MLVVPEEEGALDDLEVVGVEAAGEVEEEDFRDLTELGEKERAKRFQRKNKRTGLEFTMRVESPPHPPHTPLHSSSPLFLT